MVALGHLERDDARRIAVVLIDAIADPILVLDGTCVAIVNRSAQALLSRDPVGCEMVDVLPAALVAAIEVKGEPQVVGAQFGTQRRHWEVRVGTIDCRRRLVHLIDRTAIEAIEKMRVDFVANASHELRTPIAAIGGFAETLADDEIGSDPATRHRFVEIIAREARRMGRLVEDLMSLSKIEADRHVAPATRLDFGQIVRSAAMAAAEQRQPRGADLVMMIDAAADLTVCGERAQLAQLAHNLVSNGFKYGTPGTPVTVTARREGARAVLVIADQGEGIAAKHLPRITQRFYRVSAGRSRAVGGTGLGLAIVKHIVERHDGRLEIASTVGVGTTVTVSLPLADPRHDTVTLPTQRMVGRAPDAALHGGDSA